MNDEMMYNMRVAGDAPHFSIERVMRCNVLRFNNNIII